MGPFFQIDVLGNIFSGVVSNIISGGIANFATSNRVPLLGPPAAPVPPAPVQLQSRTLVVCSAAGYLLSNTVRRPHVLFNIVDEGTSSLAHGIRRCLRLWLRSPTPRLDVAATVANRDAIVGSHPIDITPEPSGFTEAVRSFFSEPGSLPGENVWRDRIILAVIGIAISTGSRYFAIHYPRGSQLPVLQPPATGLVTETTPVLDSPQLVPGYLHISQRDGMVVFAVSPFILLGMGSIVLIAVIITVWRIRTQGETSDENQKRSRPLH